MLDECYLEPHHEGPHAFVHRGRRPAMSPFIGAKPMAPLWVDAMVAFGAIGLITAMLVLLVSALTR